MFFSKDILRCMLLIMMALISMPSQASTSPFEQEDEEKKQSAAKGNMPDGVEEAVSALVHAVPQGNKTPDAATLAPLMAFMTDPSVKADTMHPAKRDYGQGAFFRSRINMPLRRFMQYCFNPDIPGEVVYPTVIRRNNWKPGSQIFGLDAPLWKRDANPNTPTVLRGAEFEEITPDTFSGSYYSYTQQRLLILTKYNGKTVLISVAVQSAPSSVGLKGTVVGKDSDWNYLYTKKQGSTLKLAGWADTFMYSAASVMVYSETAPDSRSMELSAVKYLKAGWAKINMVEPKHIISGAKRFLRGLKQVLESPSLPSPEEIVARKKQLSAMNESDLRTTLSPYGAFLAEQAVRYNISDSDFKKVLADNQYSFSLDREDLISELLKQFMKSRLGMNAVAMSKP